MSNGDHTQALQSAVREAISARTPLAIRGGGTKAFYGREVDASPLDVSTHRGIINYEPTELVVTVRAGTLLSELEAALAEQQQALPFEPPHFGTAATVGGTVAAGLSGPARPWAGSLRDHILGTTILNGKAQRLEFGGQVMKNVAGYDLSRLMAGAMGTLGVLLDISLKVLPRPETEITLVRTANSAEAISLMSELGREALPLSATWHDGQEQLYVRLSGVQQAVDAAAAKIGGDREPDSITFWTSVREQTRREYSSERPLWRIAVPPATPPLGLPGKMLLEWNGALRWFATEIPAEKVQSAAAACGGHATRFRGDDRTGQVFQPLAPGILKLHSRLKQSLDPDALFNPGRMYTEL